MKLSIQQRWTLFNWKVIWFIFSGTWPKHGYYVSTGNHPATDQAQTRSNRGLTTTDPEARNDFSKEE